MNRIYHLRSRADGGATFNPVLSHGGATVLVSGEVGSNQVSVRVAWCNPADTYCRKRGIEVAHEAPEKIIPLRSLPGFLGKTYREVQRRAKTGKIAYYTDLPKFDNRVLDFLPRTLEVTEQRPQLRVVDRLISIPLEQEAA